jgi:hypothetical protein
MTSSHPLSVVFVSAVALVVGAGCTEKGACVFVVQGAGDTCTEIKKTACDGKDMKFVGGTCKSAGFTKKTSDNGWDRDAPKK